MDSHRSAYEEEDKTTGGIGMELWNFLEEAQQSETLLLPDFDDTTTNFTNDFWNLFEINPPETVHDKTFAARCPADLVPTAPPQTKNSVPCPPSTARPTPPVFCPASESFVKMCPKLNIVSGSAKKEAPIKDGKTEKKAPQCKKQPDPLAQGEEPITPNQQFSYLGWLNGVPQRQLCKIKTEKEESDSDEDTHSRTKKPPSAFTLFMKEQRQKVSIKLFPKGAKEVNDYLATVWHEMSQEEQSPYRAEAEELSRIHKAKKPNRTNTVNYGKKKSTVRKKGFAPLLPKSVKIEPQQLTQATSTTQPIMMQPHLQQETSIVNPPQPTQGPFLLYDLPPGSFMWNPHSQGYLPQGPVMFEPQQYISYIQILQPQGPCNLNPFPQRPCVCNPHPQGPFMGYSEGQYIHCTRPQIPCMDNPLPQMPLSLDGLYMQNHHPQGDCQYNLAHP